MRFLESIDAAEIERLRSAREFFWLDLFAPTQDQLTEIASLVGLHELAIEDSSEFAQRPKIDVYADNALAVFYGVQHGELVEVHVHISGDWIITVHRDGCGALKNAYRRMSAVGTRTEEEAIYRILDALTDSFFPLLDSLDIELDELVDLIVDDPNADRRQAIFGMRRKLVELRRVIGPQRDALLTGGAELERLPGLDLDDTRDYLRDVVDHLTRLTEQIDGLRDLVAGALDIYLSTVSNRLNSVMKQLTLVSVIFLPLTFITGFFGQNFRWMVDHVDGLSEFILFGGGALLIAIVAVMTWFRRSGFLQ